MFIKLNVDYIYGIKHCVKIRVKTQNAHKDTLYYKTNERTHH